MDKRRAIKKEIIIKDLTDKIPPQNIEAEVSVLGAIMIDKDAIIKVSDMIGAPDFYKPSHEKIYRAMTALYESKEPIDILTLTNKLNEMGMLEDVGGAPYIATLASSVPSSANITHYAQIVAEKATVRRMISAASEIVAMGYEGTENAADVLDRAEQVLFNVSKRELREGFTLISPVLTEAFDRMDTLHKDKSQMRGVPTGFRDLDNTLAGLQRGDLVVLAARPSMGKSALALNIARNAAAAGTTVGMFSLEMSKDSLIDRLIAAESGVDSWRIRTGNLHDEDFPKIGQSLGVLSELPIYIDDSAISTVLEMRTKARRLQSETGLGLLIVDYLQMITGGGMSDNRVQEVSEISRSLKSLAKELSIPVLAISQLSRNVEQRTSRVPELSDLRESGSIEQDADVVMFIYREDYYDEDSNRKGIADIFIKKHRSGPIGKAELSWQKEYVRFRSLDKRHKE